MAKQKKKSNKIPTYFRSRKKSKAEKALKKREELTIDELKEEKKKLALKKTPEYIAKVDRIYEYILQGAPSREIFSMMLVEYNGLRIDDFNDMLEDAYNVAEVSLHKDREYVFQLHMNRYEKIYEDAMKMETDDGIPFHKNRHWNVMCMRYVAALNSLKAKETLIGLHDKSMVIELNEHRATVIENERTSGPVAGYDLEQLDLEEQKELLEYIKEARTVPIEGIQRVVVKKTVIEINANGNRTVFTDQKNIDNIERKNIQDIEFEEMPNNVVEKFEQLPDKKIEEEQDLGSMIIEDLTEGKLENKKGKEVVNEVNNNLLEELRKRKLQKKK